MRIPPKVATTAKTAVKTRLGRRFPRSIGPGRYQSIPREYRVKNLLLTEEGEVPLTYFTYKTNFGDLMSPWLLEKMTSRKVIRADTTRPHYVMIGSIINKGTPGVSLEL